MTVNDRSYRSGSGRPAGVEAEASTVEPDGAGELGSWVGACSTMVLASFHHLEAPMRRFAVGAMVAGAIAIGVTAVGAGAGPAAADPVPPGCSVYVDFQVGSINCTAMQPTTRWGARVLCQDYSGNRFYRYGSIVTGNGASGAKCYGGAAVNVDIVYY